MSEAICQFETTLEELNETNFDNSFNAYITLIQKVIEKHTPLKQLSRKQQKLKNKPWISKGIYISIRHKKRMHRSYICGDEAMKKRAQKSMQVN